MLRAWLPGAALAVAFIARWGGDAKDIPTAIVLDDRDSLFVAGNVYSRDFPVTTGVTMNGNWCAFATKLNARSGAAIYSTALCTRDMTFAFAAAPGLDGELWVAGSTDGPNLPVTPDAAQPRFGGSSDVTGAGDAMLLRWSADGRALRYATYFGGAGDERANALVADGAGGVWMAGRSISSDKSRGFLAHYSGGGRLLSSRGEEDQIVAMTAIDRHRLAIATTAGDTGGSEGFHFLDTDTNAGTGIVGGIVGGMKDVAAGPRRSTLRFRAIAALADGTVVIGGESEICHGAAHRTDGLLFVLPAGAPRQMPGGRDAAHCLGGSGVDEIHGVAAAPDGTVWVTGLTDSRDFPVTTTGPGTRPDYDTQAFLAQMDPKTGAVRFATLLGENADPRRDIARGYAVAVSKDGRVFATGEATGGSLFRPTAGAFRAGQPLASTDIYVVSLR
jgi:hypothetical protein